MTKHIEKLADLQPDQGNANLGTERGQYMLDESIAQVGAARSIVTDRDGVVIAGNKTLQAAVDAGLGIQVVQTDGNDLVVVQRTDLDLDGEGDEAERARLAAYFDNRASEVGLAWDAEQIAADIAAGMDFGPMFGDDELAEILSALAPEPEPDPGAQIDKAAELQEKWQTALGQVWEVGRHRIVCGDCTDAAMVEALMQGEKAGAVVTDPPYGLGDSKSFNDDHPDFDDSIPADLSKIDLSAPYVIWGGQYYDWLPAARGKIGWIVWDKRPDLEAEKRERADRRFGQHFEIAVTDIGSLRGKMYRQRWGGYYGSQEIWHKTQKPPELFEWCIAPTDGVVVDYFLGSSTTLVACEQLGRIGRGIELSPAYVAVSLERLAGMGLEPRLAATI